jgi:hypothetical protein
VGLKNGNVLSAKTGLEQEVLAEYQHVSQKESREI